MLRKLFCIVYLMPVFIVFSCDDSESEESPVYVTQAASATATATPPIVDDTVGPTNTPLPTVSTNEATSSDVVADVDAVALVNGLPILRTDFQKRVQQFQDLELATGNLTSDEQAQARLRQIQLEVLEGLIDQALIERAAEMMGIQVSNEELDASIQAMKQDQTDAQFNDWLALNNFSFEEFQEIQRVQLLASKLFEAVVSNAPSAMDQVYVLQILLTDSATALDILARLQAGEDFNTLAQTFSQDEQSRTQGGDLGWFPQGVHQVPPQVEAAAFSLNPGQLSEVIESVLGYHIIKVEGRDSNRPLSEYHLQRIQAAIFNDWLAQERATAHIERFN